MKVLENLDRSAREKGQTVRVLAGERSINGGKWDILSNKLKVAAEIQILDDAGEIPYFSRVAKELSGRGMSQTTVHTAINRLIDLGTINAEWAKLDDRWVRRFFVTGESKEFIRKLVDELYK
jgi:DNA-binding MarR family transcriptional regulator